MPDIRKSVEPESAVSPSSSKGFVLGAWLHVLWGWCLVSTWAYAAFILFKKVARRLLGVRNLARRQPRGLLNALKRCIAAIGIFVAQINLQLFGWARDFARWIYGCANRCWLRLCRMAQDRKIQAQRIHAHMKNRATLVFFERLKRSRWMPQMWQFFEDRMRLGRATAAEVAGLIDFSLAARRREYAVRCADVLFERFPAAIDMHGSSAVRCYLLGEYDLAETIWSRSAELREESIARKGLDALNLRFLGPSWFVAIGHIAHLDTYLKHQHLCGAPDRHYYPIVPSHFTIPNQYFLDLWRPLLSQLDYPQNVSLGPAEVELLQDEFWSLRVAPEHTLIYQKAGAAVQKDWDDGGWGPLLRIPEADLERGWEILESLGVPRGSWFVCLHVREPGFHQAWHKSHPGTRNADVATYRAAIEAIVERGGYVVRVGDATMVPLAPMPGAIDYAHSGAKSDFMDVFLCATCSFFVGTNSGLGLVPPVFGVPCVLTNWSPIAIPQWYPRDLFVPKLVLSEKDGRLLSFEELFATPAGWKQFEDYFTDHGLRVIDNTPDELRDAVLEMFDRVSGTAEYSDEDEQRRAQFEHLAVRYTGYVGSRIGRDFLRTHARLLEGAEGAIEVRQTASAGTGTLVGAL